jgi:hypothetical protein
MPYNEIVDKILSIEQDITITQNNTTMNIAISAPTIKHLRTMYNATLTTIMSVIETIHQL